MNNTQINLNELASSIDAEFYKEKSIDELTLELHKIVDKENKLSKKWLSRFDAIEALRLILSICYKSKMDLNDFIQISIDKQTKINKIINTLFKL